MRNVESKNNNRTSKNPTRESINRWAFFFIHSVRLRCSVLRQPHSQIVWDFGAVCGSLDSLTYWPERSKQEKYPDLRDRNGPKKNVRATRMKSTKTTIYAHIHTLTFTHTRTHARTRNTLDSSKFDNSNRSKSASFSLSFPLSLTLSPIFFSWCDFKDKRFFTVWTTTNRLTFFFLSILLNFHFFIAVSTKNFFLFAFSF